MGSRTRGRFLLAAAVAAIAVSVWFTSLHQRAAVVDAFGQSESGAEMLTAMLDQETGLRGFQLTGREEFLRPFEVGRRDFATALAKARRYTARDDRATRAELDRAQHLSRVWLMEADQAVARRRDGRQAISMAGVTRRKQLMDDFRAADARLQHVLDRRRDAQLVRSGRNMVLVILTLSLLFALAAYVFLARGAHRRAARDLAERRYRQTQAHFADTTQIVGSEAEAHVLVKRHLERSIPGSDVVVLRRNNSADRLEAVSEIAPGSTVAHGILDALPGSCLAIRLGQPFAAGPGDDGALIACAVCGKSPAQTTCTPLVVSGEVIGAVLMEHPAPLAELERQRVTQSVAQVAPVIANMRNLAVAEQRAATDALTGLPNRRAVADTLKRMLAQSSRALAPMSVLAIDLDHFKQINDSYGHGRGDEVLASAASAIEGAIRASDFAGRVGGEEFVVFAPGTTAENAKVVGEKLRAAIEAVEVPGVDRAVTASVGIAAYPDDAVDSESLLRKADRALYSAKEQGRDRVEVAN